MRNEPLRSHNVRQFCGLWRTGVTGLHPFGCIDRRDPERGAREKPIPGVGVLGSLDSQREDC